MNHFSDILGHKKIIEHLQNAISMGKVSHAYILSGEAGSGKKMLADCFSATLQCEARGIEPCGRCISCMQASTGNHPDIIHIKHEKSQYGVNEIREQVNSDMAIKPFSGRYKIYIIDDSSKMPEQAQNALLKTLEEPPEYGIIILLTDNPGTFLPTIISRCVMLQLKPIEQKLIINYLMEKKQIPDYLALISASFSCGNLGKAIQYATTEDFIQMKDDVLHLVKYLDDMNQSEIIDSLAGFVSRKASIDDYLDLMSLWYRDILMFKATQDANSVLFKGELTDIKHQANIRSFENLNNISLAFDKARMRLKANVNFEITMELLLLTIREH